VARSGFAAEFPVDRRCRLKAARRVAGAGAKQRMRAVSRRQPTEEAEHGLLTTGAPRRKAQSSGLVSVSVRLSACAAQRAPALSSKRGQRRDDSRRRRLNTDSFALLSWRKSGHLRRVTTTDDRKWKRASTGEYTGTEY